MPHTLDVTLQNFEPTIAKPGMVLLDWWAGWCGPCRAFSPIFEAAAVAHPDIVFGKVDTEAQPQLAAAFEVRSIPTLMIFRDGVLVYAQPGMVPGPALERLIDAARSLDMDRVRQELATREQQSVAEPR